MYKRVNPKIVVPEALPSPPPHPGPGSGGKAKSFEKDYECYSRELAKLYEIYRKADDTWEDRVYQIATGGLTLSLTIFSFLSGLVKDFSFDWKACAIVAVYAFVIILNFLSQRVSAHSARSLTNDLIEKVENKKPYERRELKDLYAPKNRLIIGIYWIEGILLIADVACTVWFLWAAL